MMETEEQKLLNSSNSSITALVPGGVVTTQNISTVIRPKGNSNSLQFVKIQTPELSKKAVEQIRIADETKISKEKIKEVEEEWQNNLLNWKSKRRQQLLSHSVDHEPDQSLDNNNDCGTRKVKTFAEMIEQRAKSGNRLSFFHLQKYSGTDENEDDGDTERDNLEEEQKQAQDPGSSSSSSSSSISSVSESQPSLQSIPQPLVPARQNSPCVRQTPTPPVHLPERSGTVENEDDGDAEIDNHEEEQEQSQDHSSYSSNSSSVSESQPSLQSIPQPLAPTRQNSPCVKPPPKPPVLQRPIPPPPPPKPPVKLDPPTIRQAPPPIRQILPPLKPTSPVKQTPPPVAITSPLRMAPSISPRIEPNVPTVIPPEATPSQRSQPKSNREDKDKTVLSISGKKRCSSCKEELGRGAAAFVVESLSLVYHTNCFRCSVCHMNLSNGFRGVDVRVHAGQLHCQNCYSKDGLSYSRV